MQRRLRKTVSLDKNLVETVQRLAEENDRNFSMQLEKLAEQALILSIKY